MVRGKAGGQQGAPALLVPGLSPSRGKLCADRASSRAGDTFPKPRELLTPLVSLRPLSAQSDARLVELVHAGNERAFETIARRYRRQLLVYADRLVGAEGRAEDALQQALMQAWVALRDGAEVGEVRAWLYRIVHNSAVSILRRARHDCVELNEAIDAAASESGPESRLVLNEIFAGLAVMPEPQREAILLTAVRGSSHGEAAAALGLTDGAVRGLVYRARSMLRRAAAGVLPVGLWNWAASVGGRRASLVGDAGGAAGSVGAGAVVMKGGAILAAAGALAGQAVLPTFAGPHRHPPTVQSHAVAPAIHARPSARSTALRTIAVGAVTAITTTTVARDSGRQGLSRHDARQPASGHGTRSPGGPVATGDRGSAGRGDDHARSGTANGSSHAGRGQDLGDSSSGPTASSGSGSGRSESAGDGGGDGGGSGKGGSGDGGDSSSGVGVTPADSSPADPADSSGPSKGGDSPSGDSGATTTPSGGGSPGGGGGDGPSPSGGPSRPSPSGGGDGASVPSGKSVTSEESSDGAAAPTNASGGDSSGGGPN